MVRYSECSTSVLEYRLVFKLGSTERDVEGFWFEFTLHRDPKPELQAPHANPYYRDDISASCLTPLAVDRFMTACSQQTSKGVGTGFPQTLVSSTL